MIEIQVKNKIASPVNKDDFLVCGNKDYYIQFLFDEEWQNYDVKTARFVWNGQYQDVVFNGDVCNVPLINDTLYVGIGVYAGDLHTTTPAIVESKKSILCDDPIHVDPPEDVYNQIIELMNKLLRTHPIQATGFTSINKPKDYVRDVVCESLDYDFAKQYFKEHEDIPVDMGGCSHVAKGNIVGADFDWFYNHQVKFHVYTPRRGKKYESHGVSGGISKLTEQFMSSGEWDEMMKMIPFFMQRAVNEHGLYAGINVVPTDYGKNRAVASVEERVEVNALELVRFVVDNFTNAKDATDYLRDYATIYFTKSLHDMEYEAHYLICDSTGAKYVVEFIDNHTEIIDVTQAPWMTNFHLYNVKLNADRTVNTPENQESGLPSKVNGITPHGSGLERHNLIAKRYDSINNADDMLKLMTDLFYTRAYGTSPNPAVPKLYTEFVGARGLTVDNTAEEYEPVYQAAGQKWLERSRDTGDTWYTSYLIVVDLQTKTMLVIYEEDGEVIEYKLNDEHGGGGASHWQDIEDKPFERIGQNLEVVNGSLKVTTTNNAEEDNTRPITSAGTHVILGNINSLLEKI